MSNLRKAWNLYNLMKSQWKPYEELRELQDRKLRAILKHAYENVPFYRQKFDSAGVHPEDIKTVEDLPRIPVTTKQEVRDNFPDRIIARGIDLRKCWLPHTSGSTGIPLTIAYDEKAEDFQKAVALRPNLSCGQGLFDRWLDVTSPLDIAEQRKRWFQRFGLLNPISISLFLDLEEQISLTKRIKPKVMDGYSSALYLLAKEILKRGLNIQPKIVFGTGESLAEEMRSFINSVFKVKMYDQFGCVELGRTAWECPAHSGYHIDIEAVVMEFIHDGKLAAPGERGEIIYTTLYNYAMPLIRYAVGDIGVLGHEKCPCGRGLPLMKSVEGRANSFIQTPSGKVFPQMTFWSIMGMFSERHKIEQFRVIQEKINEIRMQVVPGKEFAQDTIKHIVRDVRQVLGSGAHIIVEPVDVIPRDKSGKVRAVISKVKIDWDKV